jgi:hypothetical protein
VSARTATYAIATVAIVSLIVVVIGRPRRSLPADDAAVAVQSTEAQPVSDPVSTAPPPAIVPPSSEVSTAASTAASTQNSTAASTKKKIARAAAAPSTPAASTTPAAEAPAMEEPAAKAPEAEPAPTVPAAGNSAVETAGFAPVTITGCLEGSANDDRFRLTDTEGGSAPKARSWRTGFLKKRSAAVDLVGSSNNLSLEVGKRVAATGVLTNRSLKVDSVRVVSPSCN